MIASIGIASIAAAIVLDGPPEVTADRLVRSVERGVGSAAVVHGSCRRHGPQRWACEVDDAEGSGGGVYTVKTTSDGCWNARLRLAVSTKSMPANASGCLG